MAHGSTQDIRVSAAVVTLVPSPPPSFVNVFNRPLTRLLPPLFLLYFLGLLAGRASRSWTRASTSFSLVTLAASNAT